MNIASAVADIAILSIAFFTIAYSYKKGFAKVVLNIVAWFLALAFASFLATPLSNASYELLKPKLMGDVDTTKIIEVDKHLEKNLEETIDSLPIAVKNTAKYFGYSEKSIAKMIEDSFDKTKEITVGDIVDVTIKPIAVVMLRGILFIILFSVLLLILKYLVKVIDHLFKIPIISTVNKFLGGILGVIKTLIIVILISTCFELVVYFSNNSNPYINTDTVNQSYVFKYIHYNNPVIKLIDQDIYDLK